jgi:hypothetical protein
MRFSYTPIDTFHKDNLSDIQMFIKCKFQNIQNNTNYYKLILLKCKIMINLINILEDTGKILVLPVLCTSIVVPVSWPAASYYPKLYICNYY